MASHRIVTLKHATDFDGFRSEGRALLAAGVAPADVQWGVADSAEADLFGAPLSATTLSDAELESLPLTVDEASAAPAPFVRAEREFPQLTPAPNPSPDRIGRVPAAFIALCEIVILHRDPGRFGLLYRLLWRLTHEPSLRHDPIDPDRIEADRLAKAVRREMHKMTAFVRFRTVHPQAWRGVDAPVAERLGMPAPTPTAEPPALPGEPLHVAWFEPEHHIVEAIAPFFMRRFAQMHWAILTPLRSIEWVPAAEAATSGELIFGPGAHRDEAPPADAGEALWLTYYANIFNPARLKLKMMQKEMPRRYWHNLPEARLISELSAHALERSGAMIDQAPTSPLRRISAPVRTRPSPEAAEQPFGAMPGAPATVQLQDISLLKATTDRCRECPIGQYATQSVVGAGSARARLMVVGEQPGDQEDLQGLPFVGPAGQLFDRALAQLGWQRQQLYITNAVKHFKFELRGQRRMHKTPGQLEAAACRHWLEDEMRLVQPQAILALGATAARAVLGRPVAVMKERGQWHSDAAGRPVLVTLHPSALLRADPALGEETFAHWLRDLALAHDFAAG